MLLRIKTNNFWSEEGGGGSGSPEAALPQERALELPEPGGALCGSGSARRRAAAALRRQLLQPGPTTNTHRNGKKNPPSPQASNSFNPFQLFEPFAVSTHAAHLPFISKILFLLSIPQMFCDSTISPSTPSVLPISSTFGVIWLLTYLSWHPLSNLF